MRSVHVALLVALAVGGGVSSTVAQSTTAQSEAAQNSAAQSEGDESQGPKPYAEVITEEAESDDGLFTVHKVDDTYFFEIPESLFGQDMLLITRIGRVPTGFGGWREWLRTPLCLLGLRRCQPRPG